MVRVVGWHKILKMVRTPFPLKERHHHSLFALQEALEYHRFVPIALPSAHGTTSAATSAVSDTSSISNSASSSASQSPSTSSSKGSGKGKDKSGDVKSSVLSGVEASIHELMIEKGKPLSESADVTNLAPSGGSTFASGLSRGFTFPVQAHPYPHPIPFSQGPPALTPPAHNSAPPGHAYIPDSLRIPFQQFIAKERQKEINQMPVHILALDPLQMNTRGMDQRPIGTKQPDGKFSMFTVKQYAREFGWGQQGHIKATPAAAYHDRHTPLHNRNLAETWEDDILEVDYRERMLKKIQKTGNKKTKKANPKRTKLLF